MSAITLGVNGMRDLYLDRFGNLVTKTDEDAMADLLTQRLSSLVGEFRFNKPQGVPYMETVYARGAAGIPAMRAAIRTTLLASEHVVSVAYLDIDVKGTELFFECGVATDYGKIVLRSHG